MNDSISHIWYIHILCTNFEQCDTNVDVEYSISILYIQFIELYIVVLFTRFNKPFYTVRDQTTKSIR